MLKVNVISSSTTSNEAGNAIEMCKITRAASYCHELHPVSRGDMVLQAGCWAEGGLLSSVKAK